jgi:hypothetical protein
MAQTSIEYAPMAKENECPFYGDCEYIRWRINRPDPNMLPLPDNGDCGKNVNLCGRLNRNVPINVTDKGPRTDEEIKMAYPLLPNENGRPQRRLTGGGLK